MPADQEWIWSSQYQSLHSQFTEGATTPEMIGQIDAGLSEALKSGHADMFLWHSKHAAIVALQCKHCKFLYKYEKQKRHTTRKDLHRAMWWLLAFLYQWLENCKDAERISENFDKKERKRG